MLIRRMNGSDIEFAFQCASREGWAGATREVFETFLSFDPAGCFVAEQDGGRIGIGVATRYQIHGFIGELIIAPEMRGRGYGSRLFAHLIQFLQSKGMRNIYLDADPAAVPLYEKHGFRRITRSLRFTGTFAGRSHESVRKATSEDIRELCVIDSRLFGDDRGFFLKRRHELFPDLCHVQKKNGLVAGYIFGRPGTGVLSVGPIAVLSERLPPLTLLESLSFEAPDSRFRVGVLESNGKAVEFFRSVATLEEQTPCWRMVLGPSEKLGMCGELYAIGSAAKG